MKLRLPLLALTCALFAGASLSAQEQLAVYDFATDLNPTSWNTSLLTAGSKTVSFTTYNAVTTPGGRSATLGGNLYARITSMGDTQPEASKFAFTLTPQAAQSLDLGQLTFDVGYQNSGTGPHPAYTLHYQVGVTIGGGTETLVSTIFDYRVHASTATGLYLGANPAVSTPATFNLGAYQNITSSFTFTIYLYATDIGNEGTLNLNQTARIDNIMVTTAAIPEPSTVALIMGGAVGALIFVRRRLKR